VSFLLRLAYNLLRLITWPVWGLPRLLRPRRAGWIGLRIQGELEELPRGRGRLLQRLAGRLRPAHHSVHEVRRLVGELTRDPGAEGLLLTLSSLRGGWATLESLRETLIGLKTAGKRLLVFLPEGADQRDLWIASAADEIYTSLPAAFSALGPVAKRPYLTGLLAKLGIEVEVFAQGTYKTAAESVSRERMSEPEREQLSALLATIQSRWVQALGGRARLGAAGAQGLLERGMFGPEEARERGLVDRVCYPDEIEQELGFKERPLRSHGAYLKLRSRKLFVPLSRPRRVVALVRLTGAIGEAANPRGISLASTRRLLRELAEDPRVSGVILFLDSPGGSAVASELLHREIVRLDAVKPVVAWLGTVAASGGYYLAVAARKIVARPTTITGSIGVISARPVATDLMSKVGVRPEVVKLAPHADLHSLRPVDPHERELIEAETRRYYERFIDVVAKGRQRPTEDIERLAQGRVWSGADAHARGLVDVLGGYAEARAALDELLGDARTQTHREPEIHEPDVMPGAAGDSPVVLVIQRFLQGDLSALEPWLGQGPERFELELTCLIAGGERYLAYAPAVALVST
jgi:protease-4